MLIENERLMNRVFTFYNLKKLGKMDLQNPYKPSVPIENERLTIEVFILFIYRLDMGFAESL